jgi:small subunit ribosomal protein S6
MRRYDTTFILNPQIGDDRIDANVKAITSIITNGKGEVLRENRMGSRRLAYEIARQSHGYYVCLIHDSEADVINELDHHFTLADDFLRHLTIRFEGDPDRKNMSEIIMGHESERRDSDSDNERRPAASTPVAPAAPAPAVAPAAPAAPVAEIAAEDSAPAPAPATTTEEEGETL